MPYERYEAVFDELSCFEDESPAVPDEIRRDTPVSDVVKCTVFPGECPVCKERRITNGIWGFNTYACGFSRGNPRGQTACQGKHFERFFEEEEESIWDGIW